MRETERHDSVDLERKRGREKETETDRSQRLVSVHRLGMEFVNLESNGACDDFYRVKI